MVKSLLSFFNPFPEELFSFCEESSPEGKSEVAESRCKQQTTYKGTAIWREGASTSFFKNIASRHSGTVGAENYTKLANSAGEWCYLQLLFGRVMAELEQRELSQNLPSFEQLAQTFSGTDFNPVEVRDDGMEFVNQVDHIRTLYRWSAFDQRFVFSKQL